MEWLLPLGAALAMFIQDNLESVKTKAISEDRGIVAGLIDCAAWIASISTTTLSVDMLLKGSLEMKIAIILCVSIANFTGVYSGVWLGERFLK